MIQRRLPLLSERPGYTPLRAIQPDYSRALFCDPGSHDFLVWLIGAEMMRRVHRSPPPLRVRFVLVDDQLGRAEFGVNGILSGGLPCNLSRSYYIQMRDNVMRPAMNMLGVEEESPPLQFPFYLNNKLRRYVEYDYHMGPLVDAGRMGCAIPQWQPPQWAFDEVRKFLGDRKPVVITLREVDYQPERNSLLGEWIRFAESIIGDYEVLFVRDTCKATEGLTCCPTWPRASQNAYVRAALYQRALVNMMVVNGPNAWCIFSQAPYLIFKQLVPALPNWDHGQPKGWKEQDSMDVGDQYPWATDQQRLTWKTDTFENIRDAFDRFVMEKVT